MPAFGLEFLEPHPCRVGVLGPADRLERRLTVRDVAPAHFQGEGHLAIGRLSGDKWFALNQLTQLRFGLPQPIRHAHTLEHRRRGRQLLLSLLALVRAKIEVS